MTTAMSSPCDSDLGRGDHADALIAKLISACQMNDVSKAFLIYDKLRSLRVPLYEGVYTLLIECCMQTQQLGYAMQCFDTLRASGQRISTRLAIALVEACAREQHPDKVLRIWKAWCPTQEAIATSHCEVLLATVSGLIRTLSPDLAREVLDEAASRCHESLPACLAEHVMPLEDLLRLNEAVAEESRANATVLGEELLASFGYLQHHLQELLLVASDIASQRPMSRAIGDVILMDDVDLDLELAAF